MCYRGVAWLLLALGLVVCCAAHAQQRISGGSIEITLSEAGALIGLKDAIGRDTTATAAGLRFLTGAPGQADSLVEPKCAGAGNQRQLAGRLQRSGVEVKATFDGQPDRITLTVELGNPSVEQRLVEVELALPCPYAGKEKWTFFDGRVDVGAPTSKVNRNGLGGLFPLAAICDAETGLAIGIHAFEHHSWLSATVDPTASPPEFAYAVRRVLDPKGSERATFVLFGFSGKWGTAMAVDRYYDLFPEAFRLPPGVDRRFSLAGGYVHGGGREKELRWEESRRLHHGWQPSWSFRRTGDWMPDASRWPKTAGDLDAYLNKVRAEYATTGPGNPICHYVEPTQCEADLAEKEFADSIIWSRTGPTRRFLHAVPVLSGEACCRMFPFANSFYRSTAAELPLIIRDLKACGIYIDNASGGIRHYGKNLAGVPGRAYDGDGPVYATSGVGTAALADLVHTLPTGYGFAGVPTNGCGSYTIAFHTDATIQEGTPWERAEGVAVMRRLMGGKTVCWWEDHLGIALRWRSLTPAQIVEAMKANVDYCLLYGLRWGVPPAVHVLRGRAALVKNMPLLMELVQTGWRPLPPVSTDSRLWVSRYGQGLDTIIAVSNPTREPINARLVVDAAALWPDGALVFAYHEKTAHGGAMLTNDLEGRATTFSVSLAPKDFRVVRAVADVPVGPTRAVVAARVQQDELGRQAIALEGGPALHRQRLHQFAERPLLVECRKQDLLNFPFLRDGKAAAVIIVSAEATEREKTAAGRLAAYFEYHHSRVKSLIASVDQLADPSLRLPIIAEGQAIPEGMASIVLGTRQTHKGLAPAQSLFTGVTILSGRLLIAGRQPEDVDNTVIGLLRILDEKHPSTWAIYSDDMTKKAGVAGKDFTGNETPPALETKPEPEGPIALPASNLLRNGGFEEGEAAPTGWNFSSPNPDEHKCEFTKDAREGQRAVLVPKGQYWQQSVKLEAGKKYRLSVWRKLGSGGSLLLWWCGLRGDGTEASGARLYEQCRPDNDLVPNFLPASYFSQPDVWNYTETTFTAPNYPQISIRLGGWGKVGVDAAVLEPQ